MERGCEWVGTVGTIEGHVATCGFTLVPCPKQCKDDSNTVKRLMKKDLDKHLRACPHGYHKDFKKDQTQHKQKYEQIIKDKKTLTIRSVRFINLGIPRSGKTTFWYRLMKKIAKMNEKAEPSTGVAEERGPVLIKDVKLNSGMVTPDEWRTLDEGGYTKVLLEMFSQLVDSFATLAATSQNTTLYTRVLASQTAEAPDPNSDNDELEKSFSSLFNRALESNWDKLKCALEDIILLSCADTGGHAEFLDMHAALINGPSFNLLFLRLNDKLGEPFKVYYTNEDHTSTQEEDSDSTVRDVMFQVLSSITCFDKSHCTDQTSSSDAVNLKEALKRQQSKTMFVGTFKDEVSDEEFQEKDAELHREIMGTDFYKNVMFADHGKKQLMLKVDNKNGGEAEINEIRRILVEKIKKSFRRIPIPASWFILSLLIQDHKHPIMSLSQCKVLAKNVNVESEELQTALWFLHHGLGVLLYYPVGELRNTVFCKVERVSPISSRKLTSIGM